ncbi:ParB/Srx family N-terminal domain-containing protein [Bdellovibrionota bacterium FG-1]
MADVKTRKMKLKKDFTPPSFDDGDEFFPNGIFEFNITKLLSFIGSHPSAFPVENVEVSSLVRGVPDHLDENTVQQANFRNPIVLAEISPGRFNVVDGNHRLEKARREGAVKIPAYRVAAEQHVSFMKTVKGYRAYIGYWNTKVRELNG